MADGLYMPDGSYRPFSAVELSTALATRQNAGVFYGELEGWLNTLPDPDPVLRKRGDDASILAELSADDQVATAMLSRKNRVLNCTHFTLRVGALEGKEPDKVAQTLFERFQQDLERANMRSIISSMLDAPFYGYTPLELVWKFSGDWWHLVDIVARPFQWFRFNSKNEPVFVGEYGSYCAEPVLLPPGKFVFVTHHATYDNPYGLRLLSRCLWPVSFKRGGLGFYARFVERHGMPWVVGMAPSQATELEKRQIARDLSRMVQDAVAVVPYGSEIKLESAGQTQSEIHEKFLSRQDKAISKILMGQTLTVEMEGKNSQAAAQTHNEVAEALADSDKAMVVDAWNEIAWLYAQVNVTSDVLAPIAMYDEPEDLNQQADLDKKLTEIGVQFTAEHFTEVYGLKEGEFTVGSDTSPEIAREVSEFASPAATKMRTRKLAGNARVAEKAQPPQGGRRIRKPAELATAAQETLDAAIVSMLPKALKASDKFVAEVEGAIRKAKSYDELQDSLVELLSPALTPAGLENFLACAMTAAAGHGATAVQAEVAQDAAE